jgi:plastocyanin
MRTIRFLAALALVVGSFAVPLAAPVAAGDPCYHDFQIPPLTEGTDPQVKLLPCAFSPTVVRVAPGTTVEFFSGEFDVHLITGAGQTWGSRDDEIQPNSMVSFRFLRSGTYPYACALHRGMSGTIVVGDGITQAVSAGSGPAVVTVVGPAKAARSTPAGSRAAAPAAQPPGAALSTAAALVEPDPATASAAASGPAVSPLAVVALVLAIVAAGVLVRVAAARRTHRSVAIKG